MGSYHIIRNLNFFYPSLAYIFRNEKTTETPAPCYSRKPWFCLESSRSQEPSLGVGMLIYVCVFCMVPAKLAVLSAYLLLRYLASVGLWTTKGFPFSLESREPQNRTGLRVIPKPDISWQVFVGGQSAFTSCFGGSLREVGEPSARVWYQILLWAIC